jgi:hypothetical protein
MRERRTLCGGWICFSDPKIGLRIVGVNRGGGVFVATDKPAPAESGLAALVLLLRFHGIGADPEQFRHRFGSDIGVPEMLRCAKEFGLKARTLSIKLATLGASCRRITGLRTSNSLPRALKEGRGGPWRNPFWELSAAPAFTTCRDLRTHKAKTSAVAGANPPLPSGGRDRGLPIVFLSRHDKVKAVADRHQLPRQHRCAQMRRRDRPCFVIGLRLVQGGFDAAHLRFDPPMARRHWSGSYPLRLLVPRL